MTGIAIRTELQRTTTDKDLGAAATMMYWKTLSQGASTTLVAAFDPALKGNASHGFSIPRWIG